MIGKDENEMKRMFALTLILVLLLTVFSPCTLASAENDEVHALLSDYLDFLNRTEQNSMAHLWALSYLEAALDSNGWDDVLKARLAVSTASMYVDAAKLADEQTSEEMYRLFADRKQDVSLVKASRAGYALDQKALMDELRRLAFELESGIFSKNSVKLLKAYVTQYQKLSELELEYYAVSTEYLLNELGASETTEKFKAVLSDACPLITGYQSAETMTAAELEARGTIVLDKIEAVTDELDRLSSQLQVQTDDLFYCYEQKDAAFLEADHNQPSGIADALPFPLWEESLATAMYFQRDENEKMCVPKPGAEIEAVPAGCALTYVGVGEDDIYTYMLLLMEKGVEVLEDKMEDDSFEALCLYNGISFHLSWEDDTAELTMPNGIICLTLG